MIGSNLGIKYVYLCGGARSKITKSSSSILGNQQIMPKVEKSQNNHFI